VTNARRKQAAATARYRTTVQSKALFGWHAHVDVTVCTRIQAAVAVTERTACRLLCAGMEVREGESVLVVVGVF
jgi:hypothetical protein